MTTTGLNIPGATSSSNICRLNFSSAEIAPSYLDPSQPPTKRVPFRQIRNVPYVCEVQLCMPQRTQQHLFGASNTDVTRPVKYHKVIMTLKDILQDYNLRTGNHIMLAEQYPASAAGLSANSATMHLNRGQLVIEMPYEVYQRSGLGAPFTITQVAGGGRKHDKRSTRYRVAIDLRQPNMVKGKNSFDKLVWASGAVVGLCEGRMWLVAELDLKDEKKDKKRKRDTEDESQTEMYTSESMAGFIDSSSEAPKQNFLALHHPTTVTDQGTTSTQQHVLLPPFLSSSTSLSSILRSQTQETPISNHMLMEDDFHEIAEYLSLLFMQCPRITKQEYGKIDPYLCRYALPSIGSGHDEGEPIMEDIETTSWSGLISSDFVTSLVVDLIRASRSRAREEATVEGGIWAALQVNAHSTDVIGGTEGYIILLQSGNVDVENVAEQEKGEGTETRSLVEAFTRATCFEFVKSVVH